MCVCVCVRFCARRNGDDDDDDGGGERVELLLWIHVVGWTVALQPDSLSKLSFFKVSHGIIAVSALQQMKWDGMWYSGLERWNADFELFPFLLLQYNYDWLNN